MSRQMFAAAMGDAGSVAGFRAMGMETVAVHDGAEARERLRQILDSGRYAVLYLTPAVARDCQDLLQEAGTRALPAVMVLPGKGGADGSAALREAARQAVGFDILRSEEELEALLQEEARSEALSALED